MSIFRQFNVGKPTGKSRTAAAEPERAVKRLVRSAKREAAARTVKEPAKGGRPPKPGRRTLVSCRLDNDVLADLRSRFGEDWQDEANRLLRNALGFPAV